MLGAGKFHQQIEDWFVESMAETALDAINNMRDAKLGWTIVENYDPDDEIARDRWRSTPPFDMRRLLVMRIDDAATDKPIAALMSYASHRSEEHTSELQSRGHLVCRLLLEKKTDLKVRRSKQTKRYDRTEGAEICIISSDGRSR